MACYVYVLASLGNAARRTYVGWTVDPDRRLRQHNSGKGAKSTRGCHWVLIYLEQYLTRREAMRREWHLKRDRPFRRRLAANRWPVP